MLRTDVLVLQHLRQHAVASLRSALRVTVSRRVVIRRANDTGKISIFGQGQLPQVFSEVSNAGLGKPANPEAPAVAEIHFVGIQLENLLLIEALLELH